MVGNLPECWILLTTQALRLEYLIFACHFKAILSCLQKCTSLFYTHAIEKLSAGPN